MKQLNVFPKNHQAIVKSFFPNESPNLGYNLYVYYHDSINNVQTTIVFLSSKHFTIKVTNKPL